MTTFDVNRQREIVHLTPSGVEYIVERVSLWDGQRCAGSRIIAASDDISRRDYRDDDGLLLANYRSIITSWPLTAENAAWLQGEDDAGRLLSVAQG